MANQLTTARLLGAYNRELLDEGIDPGTVQTLVIEAARQVLREDPLFVKAEREVAA